jgi:hypothetical protein
MKKNHKRRSVKNAKMDAKKFKQNPTTVYSNDIEAFVRGYHGKPLQINYSPACVGSGRWVINDTKKDYIEIKYELDMKLGGYCLSSYDPRVIRFPTKYGRWEDDRFLLQQNIKLTPFAYGNNIIKRQNTVVFTLDDKTLFQRILLSIHFPTVLVNIIANYVELS